MASKTTKKATSKNDNINSAKVKKPTDNSKKKKKVKKPIGNCFVMMPFKEPYNTYYLSILKPAVVAANLEPLRGDSLFRPSPIMADVWQMIQDANVLLAELTGKNPNVFYELGLAHAIGKPIVLISETIDDVPFDLQPLRVILYDKNDPAWGNKLKILITSSLEETLSTPIEAVPQMFRKKSKSQVPIESDSTSSKIKSLENRLDILDMELRRNLFSSKSSFTTNEFIRRFEKDIRFAKSLEDVVEISRRAALKGIPKSIMFETLRRSLPPSESEKVLKEVFSRI